MLALLTTQLQAAEISPFANSILDLVGHRPDKNSVGHGRNVAIYTGRPSKFFFATHNLGDVFNAADGETIEWFPDHVRIKPASMVGAAAVAVDWQVCVTKDDVVVARVRLTNPSDHTVRPRVEISGDCRNSFDWREKPGGEKSTERRGDFILLRDRNVFPAFLTNGLAMLVGATLKPAELVTEPAGTYRVAFEIELPPGKSHDFTLACAIDADEQRAERFLRTVLKQRDPIAENRKDWAHFFDEEVPRFSCSDRGLEELYAFRWFLLKFSTAGGGLGFFKYPVVMEGRQAYQTYCCYSAPFMAFDMNWAVDPKAGFGHIATMIEAEYADGRFPWYTSPRTNKVKLDHPSASGLSLLPDAAWKHFLIHGNKAMLRQLYPGLKKNLEWWIKDRDPDGNGLFAIAHQYETGMDDLHRWGGESMTWRYEAVDATSYAHVNLRAVANMARTLGETSDAKYFNDYADKTARALNSLLWDTKSESWRDRHPQTKELADVLAITTFYPFFAGAGEPQHLGVFGEHLLNPDQFWLPHPVPSLAKDQRDFNPQGFWQGPSWPAATTHVVEAFGSAAKQMDRSLLPQAAELFRRAAKMHLQPRADFYERYNPLTGQPLSSFRDYMHSWWIDLFIQHAAGLTIQDDGSVVIDPLPLGLEHFELRGAPFRGKKIDVLWASQQKTSVDSRLKPGLTMRVNGKEILRQAEFKPGDAPVRITARAAEVDR